MGNEKYLSVTSLDSFEVKKISEYSIDINASAIVIGEDINISLTLPGDAIGTVDIYIDNEKAVTQDIVNGSVIASIPASLAPGNHTIEVSVNSDNYINKRSSNVVRVKDVYVKSADIIRGYNSGIDFKAYLLDEDGKPVEGKILTFIVGVNNYTATTDADGCAIVNRKLAVGSYNITVSNELNCKTSSFSSKIVSRLTGNNVVMYYMDGSKYNVLVYGDDGKPVGSGETVSIKIAGKTYNVKTDKNGYASLKINELLKKNRFAIKYAITAEYKGFTIKNTVKINPALKYKKQTIKKSKKKTIIKCH